MLKTAMQSMIDDAKTGLIHLKAVEQNVASVKQCFKVLDETLPTIPVLVDQLKTLREESMRHSQYAVSMENLKQIFNVPETIAKTEQLIADSRLLEAHQNLYELDMSRDDLLYQLYRLAPGNNADKNMLKNYFQDVDKLLDQLAKQLWLLIRLTLNHVRREPSVIVDALRIIEREEAIDRMVQQRYESTGFQAINRPKGWRNRVFEVLEESVNDRITGNKFHERDENNLWLVYHLEMTRKIIVDDLKVVKFACVTAFPPYYDIVRQMFHIYHRCLSNYLVQELVPNLEGNEYITLLHWINQYEGPELLGHPDLGFSVREEHLDPLLTDQIVEEVTTKYLATVEKNYKEWLANTIIHESKDWDTDHQPETDNSGHYQTTTPLIVFQMIDQHLQVAISVNMDLVNRVLLISMKHLTDFAKQYHDAVVRYARSHFDNRTVHFTWNMVAISNNCTSLMDNALKFQRKYKKDDISQLKTDKAFSDAIKSFERLKEESIVFLIKEVLLDIDREISKVGTPEWFDGSASIIENVTLTLEDYYGDYCFLKDDNFDALKQQLLRALAKSYIAALLQKKMSLKGPTQREQFANKCIKDARMLDAVIGNWKTRRSVNSIETSPFEVVPMLMEFLKLSDLSLLYLEISVSRCPCCCDPCRAHHSFCV